VDTIGNRKFVEIPGTNVHELPPLLLKHEASAKPLHQILDLAEEIVEAESVIPDGVEAKWDSEKLDEHRRYGIAVHLADQYVRFLKQWEWGESILEWIRQCEITFGAKPALRRLLQPDVWPNVGRSSFVTLLYDKAIPSEDVDFERAVGFRLTFRQPPPIDCFSDKFLILLKSSLGHEAYHAWADAYARAYLPPDRFHFHVMASDLDEM